MLWSHRTITQCRACSVLLILAGLIGCQSIDKSWVSMKLPIDQQFDRDGLHVTVHPISSKTIQALKAKHRDSCKELQKQSPKPQTYRIQQGDVLYITVWDRPDLNNPSGNVLNNNLFGHVVDLSGHIFYPYIGLVPVAGLTLPECREILTKRLSVYVKIPQVDVRISEYRGNKIYVGGSVNTPKNLSYDNIPMTVAEALDRVGGYNSEADLTHFQLLRGGKVYYLDLLQAFEGGDNAFQVYLQPGDHCKIPRQTDNRIYILGGVNTPGKAITFGGYRAKLKDAIAEAGGIGPFGDATQIYVLRRETEKSVNVYHLDLSSPIALILADQFDLNPRDIVYVDLNGLIGLARTWKILMGVFDSTNEALTQPKRLTNTIENL
jgi:polysaccharide export outer membrane protein